MYINIGNNLLENLLMWHRILELNENFCLQEDERSKLAMLKNKFNMVLSADRLPNG